MRVWLHSPELARQAQALGAYCRYGSTLPPDLSELAILVVGAYWQSGFEWHVHAPIAAARGILPEAIEAIRTGNIPSFASDSAGAVRVWRYSSGKGRLVAPAVKREAVARLKALFGLSERRTCQIAGADRKTVRYQSRRAPDTVLRGRLRGRLRDLVNERRRFGYRRRCCQTNANSSQFSSDGGPLGGKKATPLCESGGSICLEILSAEEGALLVEMVVH